MFVCYLLAGSEGLLHSSAPVNNCGRGLFNAPVIVEAEGVKKKIYFLFYIKVVNVIICNVISLIVLTSYCFFLCTNSCE
jgi:hypothetical protein